jgi:hypothetical protein
MNAVRVAIPLLLALAAALVPVPPPAVERWFSTGVYLRIQRLVTPVSNAIPIALFDLLVIGAIVGVAVAVVRAIRGAVHTRSSVPLLRGGAGLLVVAALVYLWFLGFWGFNYRRLPMSERLRVASGAPEPAAVLKLGLDAAAELNALHPAAHQEGWPEQPRDDMTLQRGFVEIQRALADTPAAIPGRLKQTVFGPYFRWTSVDGMVNPFGLEVLVNPDLLPFERPMVAAHEWAHLAGYADEAEANFVGWLTCLRGGPAAKYSGWLLMYWQVNAELIQSERAQLAAALAPGPRRDLEAIVARLRRGEWPLLRTAGWQVYDQYLKANRVEEGVRSYSLVVTLILRATFDEGWIPVRRGAPSGNRRPGS